MSKVINITEGSSKGFLKFLRELTVLAEQDKIKNFVCIYQDDFPSERDVHSYEFGCAYFNLGMVEAQKHLIIQRVVV